MNYRVPNNNSQYNHNANYSKNKLLKMKSIFIPLLNQKIKFIILNQKQKNYKKINKTRKSQFNKINKIRNFYNPTKIK